MKKFNRTDRRSRKILAGMIHDTAMLSTISTYWNQCAFSSKAAHRVGDMAVRYFKRHKQAPGTSIKAVFDDWLDSNPVESVIDETTRMLEQALREAPEDSSEYLISLAADYFDTVNLKRCHEEMGNCLDSGQTERALDCLRNYQPLNLGENEFHEFNTLEEDRRNDIEYRNPTVFGYHGGMYEFAAGGFQSPGLYAFFAPPKAGKTMLLIDAAVRAIQQKRRVLYFECGDLNREIVNQRMCARVLGKPFLRTTRKVRVVRPNLQDNRIVFQAKRQSPVGLGDQFRMWRRLGVRNAKRKRFPFKIKNVPARMMSVDQIDSHIRYLSEVHDWRPDLVIIDYADILAIPMGYNVDGYKQVEESWVQLRAIAIRYGLLLLTASQASSSVYQRMAAGKWISNSDFSGNHMKYAHADGIIGVSRSPLDRKQQSMRLNWLVKRNETDNSRAYLFGCFACCQPALFSFSEQRFQELEVEDIDQAEDLPDEEDSSDLPT